MRRPGKRHRLGVTGALRILLFASLALALAGCDSPAPMPIPMNMPVATAASAPSATPPPTRTPTPAPTPTVRQPAPVIYRFEDAPGTDHQTLHPEYGPIGVLKYVTWEDINPAPGRFDWAPLDNLLAREANLKVTLRDGRVIPKPVAIEVVLYLQRHPTRQGNYAFYDCTPEWVYQQMGDRPRVWGRLVGRLLTCGEQMAVVPAYEHPAWRKAHADMVRAFGERYRDHPQVAAIFICTGIDGETAPIKNASGCQWQDGFRKQPGDLEARFNEFVLEAMRLFREAFPQKPVYINNAPGQRKQTSDYAASLKPPLGIKNSGLGPDHESQMGYGPHVGLFDPWEVYSNTIPIWLETRYGLGSAEDRYWTFIAGLHYHPDAIDVHGEFLTQSHPGWLAFVHDHLGQTITTTPDVWVVLRDAEYPKVTFNPATGSAQSGKVGDWDYWLYCLDNLTGNRTVRLMRKELPAAAQGEVYSRQARRTDQATGNPYMSFNVDDRYPFAGQQPVAAGGRAAWQIDVTLLNSGIDAFSLEYKNGAGELVRRTVRKGPGLGPADRWVTVAFGLTDAYLANGLPGGADFRLNCDNDGDETVHMVRVAGGWGAPPAARPAPGLESVVEAGN